MPGVPICVPRPCSILFAEPESCCTEGVDKIEKKKREVVSVSISPRVSKAGSSFPFFENEFQARRYLKVSLPISLETPNTNHSNQI